MSETYRKFGRVVRRENDLLVRVDETGEAIEDAGRFTCSPIDEKRSLPNIDVGEVNDTADAIVRLVKPPLTLERLIVSDGVALHRFGETEWSERSRRIHVAIARPPYRALIDAAEFALDSIERACDAMARVSGERPPEPLRLSEGVGAALLPSLIGQIPMEQWAAPHDGKGAWIANVAVTRDTPPNWFRPSYRTRPVRAWFHLRARAHGAIDRTVPEAVALLAPIHDRTLRVLCVNGDEPFVTSVSAERIGGVVPSNRWYPYAAGSFGAEVML